MVCSYNIWQMATQGVDRPDLKRQSTGVNEVEWSMSSVTKIGHIVC